jgi:hypothetical protein
MDKRIAGIVAGVGALAIALALVGAGPASALSTKECSAKYKAAKDGGTLGGKSWNDFRKAECGSDDKPAEKSAAKSADPKPATPKISSAGVVFPTSIASKFASEKPFKQRLHTCSQQYQANKATGGNGDLRWVQKGGGYWPQCNARLKKG